MKYLPLNKMVIVGMLSWVSGCANQMSLAKDEKLNLNDYIVRINRDGLVTNSDISQRTIAQTIEPEPLPKVSAEINILRMFSQAERLAENKAEKDADGKTIVKLLIHVHGGLNLFNETNHRVQRIAKLIESDNTGDWAYPIFFSWPSNFPGSYADHLINIREGRKTKPVFGYLSAPFVLIADLAQSVGKYPLDIYYQLVSGKDKLATLWSAPSVLSNSWKKAKTEYCAQASQADECEPPRTVTSTIGLQMNWSHYYLNKTKMAPGLAYDTVTMPFRYTVGAIGQSSIAIEGWQNMKRRTSNIFYPPALFDDRESEAAKKGLAGGDFFKLLFEHIKKHKQDYNYQITLVGHSMGSIVLNNALKKYKNDWYQVKALRNIVYMAAACTINDGSEAVFPLLRKINSDSSNPNKVRFYNLTLNRLAEVSESNMASLVPMGSLLVWIDQHLEKPNHPLERTMGSEINVLSSLSALADDLNDPAVAPYVQFKSFDSYPGYIPNKHGDFNDAPFWRQRFWLVTTQEPAPDSLSDADTWQPLPVKTGSSVPVPVFNAYPKQD